MRRGFNEASIRDAIFQTTHSLNSSVVTAHKYLGNRKGPARRRARAAEMRGTLLQREQKAEQSGELGFNKVGGMTTVRRFER